MISTKLGGQFDVSHCTNFFNTSYFSRDGIYNNDIAVIRIRRKGDGSGITFSEKVSPACLPRRAFEEGKECFIAGWGKTQGTIRINGNDMGKLADVCGKRLRERKSGTYTVLEKCIHGTVHPSQFIQRLLP